MRNLHIAKRWGVVNHEARLIWFVYCPTCDSFTPLPAQAGT